MIRNLVNLLDNFFKFRQGKKKSSYRNRKIKNEQNIVEEIPRLKKEGTDK